MKPKVKHNRLIYIVLLTLFAIATGMAGASSALAAKPIGYSGRSHIESVSSEEARLRQRLVQAVERGDTNAHLLIYFAGGSVLNHRERVYRYAKKLMEQAGDHDGDLRDPLFFPHGARSALLESMFDYEFLGRLARDFDQRPVGKQVGWCLKGQSAEMRGALVASLSKANTPLPNPQQPDCAVLAATMGRIPKADIPFFGEQANRPEWERLVLRWVSLIARASTDAANAAYEAELRPQVEALLSQ